VHRRQNQPSPHRHTPPLQNHHRTLASCLALAYIHPSCSSSVAAASASCRASFASAGLQRHGVPRQPTLAKSSGDPWAAGGPSTADARAERERHVSAHRPAPAYSTSARHYCERRRRCRCSCTVGCCSGRRCGRKRVRRTRRWRRKPMWGPLDSQPGAAVARLPLEDGAY
jgi:hypothetical protein